METFLGLGLGNAASAVVLALGAASIGVLPFARRRPALRHGLWLLVLLKLVTPPLWGVPVAMFAGTAEGPAALALDRPEPGVDQGPGSSSIDPPEEGTGLEPEPPVVVVEEPFATMPDPEPEPAARPGAWAWGWWLLAAWGGGSIATFGVAARRIRQFRRLLAMAEPGPGPLCDRVRALAGRLGLRRAPEVGQVPGPVSPMVWALGCRPRLIVPSELWGRLDERQRDTLLAHELAHLRRRDHWIRPLELLVTCLYWWFPLTWIARRAVREAEEQCCDAWVVWAFPDAARSYAEALLETLDFLSGAGPAVAVAASGLGPVHHLKRRMTMIMQGTTPRTLTWGGLLTVLGLSATLLPVSPTWAQQRPTSEEMLYKVLKDEGEFNDPRWPFLIKVKDVQDKTLIGATFKHRARGPEGSNTFDMIVKAEEAIVDFNTHKGIASVHLFGGVQVINPHKDVSLIDNTTLEIPIPSDSDLVNEEDEETPAFAPERPESRDPGPRPEGVEKEKQGMEKLLDSYLSSSKPIEFIYTPNMLALFDSDKVEEGKQALEKATAEIQEIASRRLGSPSDERARDELRQAVGRLQELVKHRVEVTLTDVDDDRDRGRPEAGRDGGKEENRERTEERTYVVRREPQKYVVRRERPPAARPGDLETPVDRPEAAERKAEVQRLKAEVEERRAALREAEMRLDRAIRQMSGKEDGPGALAHKQRFEIRINKPVIPPMDKAKEGMVRPVPKLGQAFSKPGPILPGPEQEKRFAELEERLEKLQDEVRSLKRDAPEGR